LQEYYLGGALVGQYNPPSILLVELDILAGAPGGRFGSGISLNLYQTYFEITPFSTLMAILPG